MDAGLREQRAQARVRRRAERLEAREKRTRSVRKSEEFDNPGGNPFNSRTPSGVKNHYGYISRKARKEILDEAKEADKNTGKVSTSTQLPDMSIEAINSRIKKEKEAKEKKEHAAEFVGKINERESINNYQVPSQYAKTPTGTMAENAARDKRMDATARHEVRREGAMTDDTLSEEERLAARRESLDTLNSELEDATAEKLQEQAVYDPSKVVTPETDEQRETRERAFKDRFAEGAAKISERFAGDDNKVVDTSDNAVVTEGPMGEGEVDENALYAKEMEQTKYNIMRDNAGKFLRSFAQAGVDNLDKVNTAGWDMAGNMVKAMFTRPEALSSASRVIGSAMSMNEAVGKMAEDTSKRYGIAVQADPELIKDTIKYKAYKRAKEADGQVMGNAMRVLDNSLKSMGVQDITQLDSTQLGDYSDILTGEMERIRDVLNADAKVRQTARGAGLREEMKGLIDDVKNYIGHDKSSYIDPNWNGKLSGEDRALLTKTYNVLVDHMKELTKQSSVLSREEKARIAEARTKQKEKRKEQYKVSPVGWALEAISPGFTMDVNSNTGLPTRVEDWGRLERHIASELAAAEQSGNFTRPREDYEKALAYIKDARDKTYKARHWDTVKLYESSPIGWALEVAFPSFKTPIDEATGLPARLSDYGKLSTTIRAMMLQDKQSGKYGLTPQEYQDALDMLDRSREAILEQRATSKVQSFGTLAEDLVRQVPIAARGIVNAAKTGRWTNGVDASLRFLDEKINLIKADPKNAGGRYLNDPEYKVAYCMYNSALLSKQVTQLMDGIMPIMVDQQMEGTDEEKKAAKAQQDQDLLRLSQIMYEMRDVFPVDAAAAQKVDLVAPNGQDAEFKLRKIHEEMGHISDRYKAMSTEDDSTAKVKDPKNINDEVDDTEAGGASDATESDDDGFSTEALSKLFTFVDDGGKTALLNSGVAKLNLMVFMNKRGIKITPAAAGKIVDEIYQDLAINIESINGEEEEEVKGPEIAITPGGTEIHNGGGEEQEQSYAVIPPQGHDQQSLKSFGDTIKNFKKMSPDEKKKNIKGISEQLENLLGAEYQKYFLLDENGYLQIKDKGTNAGKIVTLIPVNDVNAAIRDKGFKSSPFSGILWKQTEPKGRKEESVGADNKAWDDYLKNHNISNYVEDTDGITRLKHDALSSKAFLNDMMGVINLLGSGTNRQKSFRNGLYNAGISTAAIPDEFIKDFIEKLIKKNIEVDADRYLAMPDIVDSDFLNKWNDDDELGDLIKGYSSDDWSDPRISGLREDLMHSIFGDKNSDDYRSYLDKIKKGAPVQADSKLKGLFAKAYVDRMLDRYISGIDPEKGNMQAELGDRLDDAFRLWGDYIRSGTTSKKTWDDLKKDYSKYSKELSVPFALSKYITSSGESLTSDNPEYADRYGAYDSALRKYLDTIPAAPSEVTEEEDTTKPPEEDEQRIDEESNSGGEKYNEDSNSGTDDDSDEGPYSQEEIDSIKDLVDRYVDSASNSLNVDLHMILKRIDMSRPGFTDKLSIYGKAALLGAVKEEGLNPQQEDDVDDLISIVNSIDQESFKKPSERKLEAKPWSSLRRVSKKPYVPPVKGPATTEEYVEEWIEKYKDANPATDANKQLIDSMLDKISADASLTYDKLSPYERYVMRGALEKWGVSQAKRGDSKHVVTSLSNVAIREIKKMLEFANKLQSEASVNSQDSNFKERLKEIMVPEDEIEQTFNEASNIDEGKTDQTHTGLNIRDSDY